MKEGVMGKNPRRMTAILVTVIVLLIVLVLYAFVVHPAFNGYVTNLQNQGAIQGAKYVLNTLLSQIQQNGYTQIPVGNQTVTLITPQFCSQYMASVAAASSGNKSA